MKIKPLLTAVALISIAGIAREAWAQTPPAATPVTGGTMAGASEKNRMKGKLVKGTEIVGADAFNQKGEEIGEINDLLLDENTGDVAHALVEVDGNVRAVPYKFVKQSEKDAPGYVVEVAKAKLQGAPEWKKDAMPEINDDWLGKNDTYFGTTGKKGVKLVRLSQVNGAKLFNQKGDHIGEINNTLVHPNRGKVAYGIISVGEYVGQDDKLTSVPFNLIRQSKQPSPGYVLNVEKAKLGTAIYFEENAWPDYNDMTWNETTYRYYEVSPYWDHAVVR